MNLSQIAGGAGKAASEAPANTATGSGDSGARSGFDVLLQAGGAATAAGTGAAPADTTAAADEPATAPPTSPPGGDDDHGDDDPIQADAPWPPLGLTALLQPPPAQVEPVASPLPTAPAATGEITPATAGSTALPAATTTTAAPAPATAPPAALPAAAGAAPPAAGTDIDGEAATAAIKASVIAGAETSAGKTIDNAEPKPVTALLQGMTAVMEARPPLPAAAAAALATPGAPVDLHGEGFDDAISARIGWLAEQKIGHAQIRITPHDLGQIDVKLQLDGDRVHATFSSAHAEVRHALESSVPRLREMLGEQGLQLAQADVGDQSPQHSASRAPAGHDSTTSGTGDHHDGDAGITTRLVQQRGLLDAYA